MASAPEPVAALVRGFGSEPATGLDGVADVILRHTRLQTGDRAAIVAVLQLVVQGSTWRAVQLQDPVNVTALAAMSDAARAAGSVTAADTLVASVVGQVHSAMFPRPGSPYVRSPAVAPGNYFAQWWRTHVRRG